MTERAEASEALSTQIVNSLTAGLLVVDRQGLVQIVNPAGREMLGLADGVEGSHINALPHAAIPLAGVVSECLTTGQPIVRRALEVPQANDVTHVGVTASRFGHSEGATGGVICLFSDLTAVIALEEQLRLKEALARLGEMTAGIAHEFRNGLATIHGYGKLIDPSAGAAAVQTLCRGYPAGDRSAWTSGHEFPQFRAAHTAVTRHAGSGGPRPARRRRSPPRDSAGGGEIIVSGQFGRVDADDVLLRQAFSNLLRNAIEACQHAKVVPHVRVEGSLDAAQARISVHDNGPGSIQTRAIGSSVPSSRPRRPAPDSGSRSCRRSSSPTTAA